METSLPLGRFPDDGASAAGRTQSGPVARFDQWLRQQFVELNTKLEDVYFAAGRCVVSGPTGVEALKQAVLLGGGEHIVPIVRDGTIPAEPVARYRLLGAVGFYLAACRRHEVDDPQRAPAGTLDVAWSLAARLGAALGVAPRFVFAHQSFYGHRMFTALDAEDVWVTNNALGVLAYQRAADALRKIPAMGVSSPAAAYLFDQARSALDDVLRFNRTLSDSLDVDRFSLNIRTYFKSYRVGAAIYRGANAGDFAAINEIDLLLGVCRSDDPFYQGVLADKYPYVPPEDQPVLRRVVTCRSLLADLLALNRDGPLTPPARTNAALFLSVWRAHGAAYAFHHYRLVKPFLEQPVKTAPAENTHDVTASGPPLEVVIASLARLADLRAGRDRPGAPTARAALDELREAIDAH